MNHRMRLDRLEAALIDNTPALVILDEDTPEIRADVDKRLRAEGVRCIVFGEKWDADI